jgi:hypothetical protein
LFKFIYTTLFFQFLFKNKKVLKKIKANEDPSEYCLLEHIEIEQNNYSPSTTLTTTETTKTTTTTSNDGTTTTTTETTRKNSKGQQTTSGHQMKRKNITKTRVLGLNENMFVLTHVWNKMKAEKVDSKMIAKVILTKKAALNINNNKLNNKTKAESLSPKTNAPRNSIGSNLPLVKPKKFTHRMSVQSFKPFVMPSNFKKPTHPSPLPPSPPPQPPLSPPPSPPRQQLLAKSNLKTVQSLMIHDRSASNRRSMNRFVRQKSFETDNISANNSSLASSNVSINNKNKKIVAKSPLTIDTMPINNQNDSQDGDESPPPILPPPPPPPLPPPLPQSELTNLDDIEHIDSDVDDDLNSDEEDDDEEDDESDDNNLLYNSAKKEIKTKMIKSFNASFSKIKNSDDYKSIQFFGDQKDDINKDVSNNNNNNNDNIYQKLNNEEEGEDGGDNKALLNQQQQQKQQVNLSSISATSSAASSSSSSSKTTTTRRVKRFFGIFDQK